jgi:hypothetical protein
MVVMNRPRGSTCQYRQQHAQTPVHWWPWGDEAFVEAKRRDDPILVSVGRRELPLVPGDVASCSITRRRAAGTGEARRLSS